MWDLCRKLANHNTFHFRSFIAKSNNAILHKSTKTVFLGLLGTFSPFFGKLRVFPKNQALSLLSLYGPLTSCKISKKTNEPIPRKLCYRWTHARKHGRGFIGPIRLKTWGTIIALQEKIKKTKTEFHA